MKRLSIITGVVLVAGVASLFIQTHTAITKIEALEGRTGDLPEMAKPFRGRLQRIESSGEIERACMRMNLSTLSNLNVFRFTGEGLPYFAGLAAYDTNKHQMVRVTVDRLW
jgi:hypothetical protein